jgi:hypothetical protein
MTPKPSEGSVVPKNYDEMQQQYGPLIYKLLCKYNKIDRNMEDLHSYVWVKLLEANLLERFDDYVQRQTPKTLTAIEACDFLGVSWKQWVSAMYAYHKGVMKRDLLGFPVRSRRNRGPWMPMPINIDEAQARHSLGYNEKGATYSFMDIIRISLDERGPDGRIRRTFKVMGQAIDSDGKVIAASRPEGLLNVPGVTVTKAQFRNYLTMAVLNHYANFCRTEVRRHKERPHTPPAYLRDEDAPTWESTLPDPHHSDSDTVVALAQARKMLSDTLHECADGVTLCKPIEEHEIEVFAMLADGASLMQALRDTELPSRVRTAVLDTIRPLAPEF